MVANYEDEFEQNAPSEVRALNKQNGAINTKVKMSTLENDNSPKQNNLENHPDQEDPFVYRSA